MIKIKAAELKGPALDWAIAVCEGETIEGDPMGFRSGAEAGYWIWDDHRCGKKYMLIGREYSPSTSWCQAGPIMEREDIYPSIYHGCGGTNPNRYMAGKGISWVRGETALMAAMRSLVLAKLGDEIEVPEKLASQNTDAVTGA